MSGSNRGTDDFHHNPTVCSKPYYFLTVSSDKGHVASVESPASHMREAGLHIWDHHDWMLSA